MSNGEPKIVRGPGGGILVTGPKGEKFERKFEETPSSVTTTDIPIGDSQVEKKVTTVSQGASTTTTYPKGEPKIVKDIYGGVIVTQPTGEKFARDISRDAFRDRPIDQPPTTTTSKEMGIKAQDVMITPQVPEASGQRTSTKYTAEEHIAQKERGDILFKGEPSYSDIEARAKAAGYPEGIAKVAAGIGIVAGGATKGISDLVQGTAETAGRARRVFFANVEAGEKFESPSELAVDVAIGVTGVGLIYAGSQAIKERGILAGLSYSIPGAVAVGLGARSGIKSLGKLEGKSFMFEPEVLPKKEFAPKYLEPKLPKSYEYYVTSFGDIAVRRSDLIKEAPTSAAEKVYGIREIQKTGVDVIDIDRVMRKPEPKAELASFEKKVLGEQIKFSKEEGFARQKQQDAILKDIQNLKFLEEDFSKPQIRLSESQANQFIEGLGQRNLERVRLQEESRLLGTAGKFDVATGKQEFSNIFNLNFLEEPVTPKDLLKSERASRQAARNKVMFSDVKLPDFFDKSIRERLPPEPKLQLTEFEKRIQSRIATTQKYNVELPKFFDELPKRVPLSERTFTLKDVVGPPKPPGKAVTSGGMQLLLKEPKLVQKGKIITLQKTTTAAAELNTNVLGKGEFKEKGSLSLANLERRRTSEKFRFGFKLTEREGTSQVLKTRLDIGTKKLPKLEVRQALATRQAQTAATPTPTLLRRRVLPSPSAPGRKALAGMTTSPALRSFQRTSTFMKKPPSPPKAKTTRPPREFSGGFGKGFGKFKAGKKPGIISEAISKAVFGKATTGKEAGGFTKEMEKSGLSISKFYLKGGFLRQKRKSY